MLKISTLKGQIAICILLSLPILTIADMSGLMKHILTLLIPLVVFCVLFRIKNSKGSEFKVIRIIIAMLLWGEFWVESFIHGKYWNLLEQIGLDWRGLSQISKGYGFNVFRILEALFASYIAIAIATVVIFSYVIGKWANCETFVNNGDQINEKRE